MYSQGEKDLYNEAETHLVEERMEIQLLCKYLNKKKKMQEFQWNSWAACISFPSLQDTLLSDD